MNIVIFVIATLVIIILLITSIYSLIAKDFEFFPPPSKSSWQYRVFWVLFRIMFFSLVVLSFSAYNTFYVLPNWLRLFVGFPLLMLGFGLAVYLSAKLGWENAHGEDKGLVVKGWYRYSRNPIYLTSFVGMLGWGLFVNSGYVYCLLVFWALMYIIAPFAEEPWLEKKYGKDFKLYKSQVPRFLGWRKKLD